MEAMTMTKEAAAIKLTKIFPDKAAALTQHYTDYDNQLRAHIFFADEINIPLMLLLQSNSDKKTIQQYCSFIEEMYYDGDEDVENVVEVTILEQLSDETKIWLCFGPYLSNEFIREINTVLIPRNTMLPNVSLPYHSRKKFKKLQRIER